MWDYNPVIITVTLKNIIINPSVTSITPQHPPTVPNKNRLLLIIKTDNHLSMTTNHLTTRFIIETVAVNIVFVQQHTKHYRNTVRQRSFNTLNDVKTALSN